jgi:hypothetical protein
LFEPARPSCDSSCVSSGTCPYGFQPSHLRQPDQGRTTVPRLPVRRRRADAASRRCGKYACTVRLNDHRIVSRSARSPQQRHHPRSAARLSSYCGSLAVPRGGPRTLAGYLRTRPALSEWSRRSLGSSSAAGGCTWMGYARLAAARGKNAGPPEGSRTGTGALARGWEIRQTSAALTPAVMIRRWGRYPASRAA